MCVGGTTLCAQHAQHYYQKNNRNKDKISRQGKNAERALPPTPLYPGCLCELHIVDIRFLSDLFLISSITGIVSFLMWTKLSLGGGDLSGAG